MSATKINESAEPFARKITRLIKEDKAEGYSRLRLEMDGHAFLCDVLEVGGDYLEVSQSGNLRVINIAQISTFQLVTNDPGYAPDGA